MLKLIMVGFCWILAFIWLIVIIITSFIAILLYILVICLFFIDCCFVNPSQIEDYPFLEVVYTFTKIYFLIINWTFLGKLFIWIVNRH